MLTRRRFLVSAASAAAGAALGGCALFPAARPPEPWDPALADRKLIVILFGGGTGSSTSIDDPERRYIPRLWNEMVPRGTLFSNMRVATKAAHLNAAGSILTGHWESSDPDSARPVEHPTIFEIYREARRAPDTAAWSFVYASSLAQAGQSSDPHYGRPVAANVVCPPAVLRQTADEMENLMRRAANNGSAAELAAATQAARLFRSDSHIATNWLRSDVARQFVQEQFEAWQAEPGASSADAFLARLAQAAMRQFAPPVISIAFGEIDGAQDGSWSRYVEAIRRTDDLAYQVWQAAEELPAYRRRTMLLILPVGSGPIDPSDSATEQAAVWMLALAPGVPGLITTERPTPITAVAATGLKYLGLSASAGAAPAAL